MRTFVAVDLSPEIKKNLEDLIRNVRRKAGAVRWVGPEAMHLTLKFLGEIPEDKAAIIGTLLEGLAGTHRPFPLKLRGTGTFPPGGGMNARVIWAGVVEDPGLMELQAALEDEFEKTGFSREDRPFHPHLTLGRVKSPDGLDRVLQELERYGTIDLGEMMVARFTFFRSLLKPFGPEYQVLTEAALK